MAQTDPTSVVIRQVRQVGGPDGLTLIGDSVTLTGPDMPEQIARGAKLRSTRTYYPGRSTASRQVMGTGEDDIELAGQFRDVWTGLDGGARAQYGALRKLFLGQSRCELAWGAEVVCRGYITSLVQTYTRLADIGYRLTFEVDESDEAEVIAPTPYQLSTAADLTSLLDDLLVAAEVAAAAVVVVDAITGVV